MWFVFVIPLIIFFVIFLAVAKSIFFSHKSAQKDIQDMVMTISAYTQNNTEVKQEVAVEKVCEYCGAKLPNGADKCPSCGASKK